MTPASRSDGSATTLADASASIDDNGNAVFRSGSIGGFTLTDNEISASGLSLKSSGQITGSNFLLEGGTITSDVVILSSIAANSILTPASRSDGSATTLADASASIDDKGNAVFRSGSIGGFAFTSTVLSASKFELDTANEKLTLGSGNSVFIADSGDGIQLGNATFGSAPFRVNMDGDLTATSVTISGNITATAGPVSQSLTALGIKTGSLDVSSSLASSSLERVKIITGSLIVSSSLASSSLESVKLTTGSLEEASSSLSEASSSLSDASSSLSAASESMQKQFVLVDDDTLNLQNAKGGILSSFSDYAKFFGSASNALVTSSDNGTINYTEINDKGFLVVTGSSTASFFGNVTTIGDTTAQHISIAPDSLSIKTANNKTVLSASAGGIDMSGSITAGSGKIANWDIDGNKLESFNSSTKGIVLDADPSTPNITIQEDSNNKIELFHTTANNFGLKGTIGGDVLFRLGSTNEIGGFSITENAISSSNNKLILRDSGLITASAVQITGEVNASSGTTATSLTAIGVATASLNTETGSLNTSASLAALSASAATASIAVNESSSAAVTSDVADTRAQLVLDNSTANNQKINLVNTTGGIMSSFGKGVKFFGSASNALVTSSANGTVNYSEINDKGFLIVTGSTTASFFGNTTTIGDTTAQHISIEPDSLSIKTANNVTVLSASADGISMSGSIKANGGTIGGMTIDDDSIFAGTKDTSGFASNNADITIGTDGIHTKTFFVNTDGTSGFKGTLTIGSTDLTAGNTLNTNTDLSDVGLSLSDISGSISGSFLADASSSLSAASKSMADQVILSSNAVTVQANADNRAELTSNGLEIFQGGTSRAVFDSTTTIGNTSGQHISIDANSIDIKTAANVTALSASSAGIVMSGSITATQGNIGGFKINNQELSASGLSISATDQRILVTGSNSITDGNSVIIDGGDGVIQVSQSGEGVFDSGRTEQFERFIIIEPPSFRRNLPVKENISSSLQQTDPVSTMGNAVVTESLKTKFFELDKYIHKAAGISNTPFYYQDVAGGAALNPNARLNNGGNPTSSVFFGVSRNLTAGDSGLTGSLFGPEFVFSADYFTDSDIETRALYGFVSSSDTGSNIFTIATRMSRSVADHDVNFGDAKFNILGLETDLSGLANARQNEYTFLQAKHSQSIRLQIQHDGDIVSKGNVTAFGTSFLSVSDEREKEYIYQISESLNKVSKLRPTKFTWKETQKEDVGFIAQEVEKIIPEVVETTKGFINTDEDMNRKTISYPKLIPYLVDTIQELTKRIEELEKKVK